MCDGWRELDTETSSSEQAITRPLIVEEHVLLEKPQSRLHQDQTYGCFELYRYIKAVVLTALAFLRFTDDKHSLS